MRRISAAFATVTILGSTLISSSSLHAGADLPHRAPTLQQCRSLVQKQVLTPHRLTVATDNPVYAPWFIKDDPTNGQGYESAVAYQIAHVLGFDSSSVKWVTEPFVDSYAPGPKAYDFDINEAVYSADRAKNVTFSHSYYDVQQSLVAMKSDPIVRTHEPEDLAKYRYGALSATAAASYVTKYLKPSTPVKLYAKVNDAVVALETNAIDAIVVDTPTGNLLVTFQITDTGGVHLATQVGQFPAVGNEWYALELQQHNPLASCLNVALKSIRLSGELHKLRTKWLGVYNQVPTIKP